MSIQPIPGLHHVTAIASDPQRNLDFYTQVLGLRFVKRTVNFDDPGTYHFYFGDDLGTPGTILTFFPWPHASRGSAGLGEVTHTAFQVPSGSLEFWERRLASLGVPVERSEPRFHEQVLTLADPDGMKLELVALTDEETVDAVTVPPRFSDVPAEYAIGGFFGVTMLEMAIEETAQTLAVMGFYKVAEEGNRVRFAAAGRECAGKLWSDGRWVGPSHRVSGRRRCCATGLAHRDRQTYPDHGGARPRLLSLDLLPRAGRCAVRDCYRQPGVCGR
jgi:glyoxalase family protein